ncbi:RHS repeat domain-containing protein [Pseudoalteromonas xiamenensis]
MNTTENGFTLSRSSKKVQNAFGQISEVIETVDGVDHTVAYSYDATGNVISTTALGQVAIVTPHDSLGRKISMTDPDKGIWTYTYNALGEIVRQESQRSSSETLVEALYRDQLGRNTRKVTNDGTIIYQYNQQRPYLLESEYFAGSNGIDKTYQYDVFGRVTKVSQALDNGELYTAQITYDEYGRVFQQFDPESGSVGCFNSQGAVFGECKGIENRYNPQGYLVSKSEAQQTITGTIYYHVKAIDALGNVTESELGNGLKTTYTINQHTGATEGITTSNGVNVIQNLTLKFDGLGNLRERDRGTLEASYHGKNERFGYDGFNRLTTIDGLEEVRYQDNGNISWKRNVGFYCYNSSKPNQLTGLGSNVGCTSNDYRYDNHGNMLVGRGNTIAYGANSKPTSIRSRDGLSLFNYDTTGNRYKQVTTEGGKTTTTYYVGNLELVQDGEGTQVRRYLPSAIETAYTSGRTEIRYLHSDHLGSIDTITDSRGKIVEKVYFDAWGKRQSIAQAYWQTTVRALTAPELLMSTEITPRGFTGHEHIDHADIIHMNGRIYDPTLGRFLQADPHIQAPKNSQSYNRYSYVLNNPLSYTDPSGYFWNPLKKIRRNIIRAAVKVFGAEVVGMVGNIASMFCGPWAPACAGAWNYEFSRAMGASSTGALRGAFTAAATVYAFQQIGGHFKSVSGGPGANISFGGNMLTGTQVAQQIAAHALVGGISAELNGGKFGHGFFSAGVTKGLGGAYLPGGSDLSLSEVAYGTVVSAVIGGTASAITGGKFANGANTAAMQYLFNQASKVNYSKIWKDMKRTWNKYWKGSNQELAQVAVAVDNAASIAYNNPSKTLAAGGSVIGGLAACMTVKGCILGGPMIAYGVDQTHTLVNGNNMTTSQQYLGDALSHPDARAAFPFIENPHNAAGTIIDISTFAAGGAGVSTLNLYNGTGNTMDVINAINDANTLKNY